MFRTMRRAAQALSDTQCEEILTTASHGTLAVSGDDGYAYAVPLSFVYENGKLYFHCAADGHKMDALRRNDKVSFSCVAMDSVKSEAFTTLYRSVVLFGRARTLADESEKRAALEKLITKYCPAESRERVNAEITGGIGRLEMVEITVEHLSGKQAKELCGR